MGRRLSLTLYRKQVEVIHDDATRAAHLATSPEDRQRHDAIVKETTRALDAVGHRLALDLTRQQVQAVYETARVGTRGAASGDARLRQEAVMRKARRALGFDVRTSAEGSEAKQPDDVRVEDP